MLAFNINQIVKCKLTNHGLLILRNYYQLLLENNWATEADFEKLTSPKFDGFYHFQMHQFIRIFGDKISYASLPAVESCLIYFDEKDMNKC